MMIPRLEGGLLQTPTAPDCQHTSLCDRSLALQPPLKASQYRHILSQPNRHSKPGWPHPWQIKLLSTSWAAAPNTKQSGTQHSMLKVPPEDVHLCSLQPTPVHTQTAVQKHALRDILNKAQHAHYPIKCHTVAHTEESQTIASLVHAGIQTSLAHLALAIGKLLTCMTTSAWSTGMLARRTIVLFLWCAWYTLTKLALDDTNQGRYGTLHIKTLSSSVGIAHNYMSLHLHLSFGRIHRELSLHTLLPYAACCSQAGQTCY